MNITPDNITHLDYKEIFVFGSNESGRHGKGAAKTALKWGAKYGKGFGLFGNTFGIPTKDTEIRVLPLKRIKGYIDLFEAFALSKSDLKFLVTEIGCGLAGFTPEEVAPLFKKASKLSNVYLPKRFWDVLNGDQESKEDNH